MGHPAHANRLEFVLHGAQQRCWVRDCCPGFLPQSVASSLAACYVSGEVVVGISWQLYGALRARPSGPTWLPLPTSHSACSSSPGQRVDCSVRNLLLACQKLQEWRRETAASDHRSPELVVQCVERRLTGLSQQGPTTAELQTEHRMGVACASEGGSLVLCIWV